METDITIKIKQEGVGNLAGSSLHRFFKGSEYDTITVSHAATCLALRTDDHVCSARRFWHWHQRLGRRRRPPLQKVPPQQPPGRPSAVTRPLPPVAREALRRRAAARPVPNVHAVQGHERGLAWPAGNALLQAWDRSSSPQAETAEPKEDVTLDWERLGTASSRWISI